MKSPKQKSLGQIAYEAFALGMVSWKDCNLKPLWHKVAKAVSRAARKRRGK